MLGHECRLPTGLDTYILVLYYVLRVSCPTVHVETAYGRSLFKELDGSPDKVL